MKKKSMLSNTVFLIRMVMISCLIVLISPYEKRVQIYLDKDLLSL